MKSYGSGGRSSPGGKNRIAVHRSRKRKRGQVRGPAPHDKPAGSGEHRHIGEPYLARALNVRSGPGRRLYHIAASHDGLYVRALCGIKVSEYQADRPGLPISRATCPTCKSLMRSPRTPQAPAFSPKNDSDYTAQTRARLIVKSRSHEKLVRDFGEWATAQGFQPSTPHPRDLVLKAAGKEWLVEVKIVYDGNTAEAVRAAIGQLFDYRYSLYVLPGLPAPALLALFSEPIGQRCAGLLESLSIAAVWRAGGAWGGAIPRVTSL